MAKDNNEPLDLVDPRIAEFKLCNNLIKIKKVVWIIWEVEGKGGV